MSAKGRRLEPVSAQPRWRRIANRAGAGFLALVTLEIALRVYAFIHARQLASVPIADGSTYTIACVGDSWTEGRADGRYPEILARRLDARHDGRHYRVVNLGQSGTNSSQALKRLASQVDSLRPQLVLVMTGNNDHWNLTDSAYWEFSDHKRGRAAILALHVRLLVRSLRVVRLAAMIGRRALGKPTENEFFDREHPPAARSGLVAIDRETHRRQLVYNLTEFVALGREKNFEVVFLDYFHFHGYGVEEIIGDVASSLGVAMVDNTMRFHTLIPIESRALYTIPDGHPSPRGYEFMVDGIVEALEEHGILQKR